MKNIKNYYPLLAILFIFILGVGFSYLYFPIETKSNVLMAFITFLVGTLVVYLYIKQKDDTKRDAAKIILQEIRRAEDIIGDYKQSGGYQFAKKIIATNSWSKNIHFFVGDLDNDELDKISDLYSTGEYLDDLVKEISDITLEHEVNQAKTILQKELDRQLNPEISPTYSGPSAINFSEEKKIILPALPAVWKKRLDVISLKLETIYHSTIVLKLKKIAKLK